MAARERTSADPISDEAATSSEEPAKGRPRRGEARQAFLDAGLEALKTATPATLITGVGVRELARRAGVSAAGFYHHFPTVEDYAAALVEHVYDSTRVGAGETVSDGVERIRAATLPVEQAYTLHASELQRVTTDAEFRVRVGLWALGGPQVDAVWARFLAEADDLIAPAMDALVQSWGREPRPPFTLETAVAMHVALVQGAAMRNLIAPERLPLELFTRAATALSFVQLRFVGDSHTVDDRLAEINYYPLRRTRPGRSSRTEQTRAKVLEAAAELFGLHGFDATSVNVIARRAGASPDTVYATFGSKAGLAVELFLTQAQDHFVVPPALEHPERTLRELLAKVAVFAATRPDTTPRYLDALLTGSRPDEVPDPLVDQVGIVLEALVADGTLRDDRDLADLGATLLWATCRRIMGHPAEGPMAAADHAVLTLVDGARAR